MEKILVLLEFLLGSYPFLITVNILSFSLKACLLYLFISRAYFTQKQNRLHLYLFLILIGAMAEDFAWSLLLFKECFFPDVTESTLTMILFIARMAWTFYAIECQSLALLLENLSTKNSKLRLRQKLMIGVTTFFCLSFIVAAIYNIPFSKPTFFLHLVEWLFSLYAIFILLPSSVIFSTIQIRKNKVPRILKKQFNVLVKFLIVPRIISELIQYYPFSILQRYFSNNYAMIGISTSLLTVALFYCTRKIIGLRFLNFQNHVQEHHRFNFVDGFKDTLEDLAKATSMYELGHISQAFFKTAFDIPSSRVSLHLRHLNHGEAHQGRLEFSDIQIQAEALLANPDPSIEKCINKVKILIYDEIDFNNFYDKNNADETILAFMDSINADIFLPIYKNHSIIGYIIVERYARLHEFYSHIERDEMIIFASYLSNIINLIQNRNLEALIYQEKELKEELYKKHQEINQYKESINSFLKNHKQKDIGIIFYKNRHFVFANQAAKEIIKINVNTHLGSPLTKALKNIAEQVEEYKSPQGCITKNSDGHRIVINGVPNLEKNHVIITVYYPDFSDILTSQMNHLKDPTNWDYLLYLETTRPGQLINQLIPGSGEQLLQFKINLLQIALSKKALLLEIPEEDLMPTVELLHHISMRDTLHALSLQSRPKNSEVAIKLFGINPLFGVQGEGKPLFEKLDNGTLFIQNIELLDLETQEYLAEYIKYGHYRIFKSNQKMNSAVRIICSTHQNLSVLAQEGTFSAALLTELKRTSLVMPSLMTLPESELYDLAQGIAEQSLKSDDFKTILDLNAKDKTRIIQSKPASIHELKVRVQQLLAQKSKQNNIDHEVHFDPAYDISDPELAHAARLGKHALRDPRMMALLWNKFGSQTKIATFLGVNRSSINRRIKSNV